MPFDANLILANDDADWTFANLVTSDYGSPTSTTRNAGGFAVLDLRDSSPMGLSIVLICMDEAAAADDALTVIIEESSVEAFSSDVHELGKFDIAAATKGILLGSEQPCTIVRRVVVTKQYLRVDASNVAGDNQGTCWVLASPYPYKDL